MGYPFTKPRGSPWCVQHPACVCTPHPPCAPHTHCVLRTLTACVEHTRCVSSTPTVVWELGGTEKVSAKMTRGSVLPSLAATCSCSWVCCPASAYGGFKVLGRGFQRCRVEAETSERGSALARRNMLWLVFALPHVREFRVDGLGFRMGGG